MANRPNAYPDKAAPAVAHDALGLRRSLVRILFIHGSPTDVERCLYELKRLKFTVSSKIVLTPAQCLAQLRAEPFDIVVAEYPSGNWKETQPVDLLREMQKDIPIIYIVDGLNREGAAGFILKGATDCINRDNIGHLPVAIHRALNEASLRDQRDRAEKSMRHSEARYRALAGNLSYGICRCNLDGKFLEVNNAMIRMLGCESEVEALALDLARDMIQDPGQRAQLLGQSDTEGLVEPFEVDWKRKDCVPVKVRLSGREVFGDAGGLEEYEVIAEDVTKQRELEGHLRRQASSDPLTGLANYRRLVEVLDVEIKRSKRTDREFAMLFFDMDGLKAVNDRYGHVVGSQALCRLADALCSCCRDIDTAARFGGDEFALVLPETNTEAAELVARRICESISNDGKSPQIAVSVGIAVYPRNGDSIESLLHGADSALYAEKQHRRVPEKSSYITAGR
jgi:diguanylate cyclase (GGDEF)-like protein/PAS domain S-box-containing protein